MALEAVVFPQDHIFSYNGKDLSNIFIEEETTCMSWSTTFYDLQESQDFLENRHSDNFLSEEYYYSWNVDSTTHDHHHPHQESLLVSDLNIPNSNSSDSTENPSYYNSGFCEQKQRQQDDDLNIPETSRAKRRRSRTRKNKEEIENQRMTHIAVERNRRKQMNEYLSVLRSLMPESYIQRGDQASIVGGAINFVRELEHRLHLLNVKGEPKDSGAGELPGGPFADVFKFPQFSMRSSGAGDGENAVLEANALADIEVSLVESHASLKIRSKRRPKLLLNVVSGLQNLGFIILHLNVSTVDDFVLYCFSTKVEDDSKLTSVADIATAVYQMLCMIHQEEAQ